MKSIITIFWLLFTISATAFALEVPALRGHVNDYANILSPQTVQQLESELSAFERSDSTQIVVLTIPTLEGESLEDFSIKVAEAWRIGQKKIDNGVIFLIAKQEHKIRIEVGRGLEGKLTDLVSGRIIRGEIAPRFKAGDFDGGVTAGVAAIISVVRGEYTAQPQPREQGYGKRSAHPVHSLFTFAIFLMVACIFLGSMSRLLGGVAGAVGLPIIAFLLFPGLAFFLLIGLGVAGFLIGLFLTFLFGGGGRGGGFFGGGGPFMWGGGGFGGFGGGGGGFSGGGGDFGGGGASGDW